MQQAIRAKGQKAAKLRLKASQRYLESNLPLHANNAINQIEPDMLSPDLLGDFWLIKAELLSLQGKSSLAREVFLKAINLPFTSPRKVFKKNARICSTAYRDQISQVTCQIENLGAYRPSSQDKQLANDEVWKIIGKTSALNLEEYKKRATQNTLPWWVLLETVTSSLSLPEERTSIARWRAMHASDNSTHIQLPSQLEDRTDSQSTIVKLGLVLPLTGTYSTAAKAVRDGFISAYLISKEKSAANTRTQRSIILYDSETKSLSEIIADAENKNIDILVGPLLKKRVKVINQLEPSLPTLTLNYLEKEDVPSSNIYQLGLAIEDEAKELLKKIAEDKIKRVLVIKNEADWANRASNQILEDWPHHQITKSFSDIKQITGSVGIAMGVEASNQRHNTISRKAGVDLEFIPRARQDIDGVIALVNTIEAQALKPALQFHFGEHLPIYATSQTTRTAAQEELANMDGILVSESPWVLNKGELYKLLDDAFHIKTDPLSPLYALGVDAYRISDRLELLKSKEINELLGSVGALSIEDDNKVIRGLPLGLVNRGKLIRLSERK